MGNIQNETNQTLHIILAFHMIICIMVPLSCVIYVHLALHLRRLTLILLAARQQTVVQTYTDVWVVKPPLLMVRSLVFTRAALI